MLKISYSDKIEDIYYKKIASTKGDKFGGLTFEEFYNKNYKRILKYTLKDILCGDFKKLKEIKNKNKFNNGNNIKRFFNYDKAPSNKVTPLLSKLQPKISKFFEEYIDVHTCYYCNIDFINKFKKDKDTKNAFTLDHVLEKASYPYLALSLYNLVPSCYVCNSKVKDSKIEFEYSPTSKEFKFDNIVKFKTFIQNPNLQIDKEIDFGVRLIESYSSKYDDYIKSLNLNNRYEYHKYKVLELIKKRREYPDSKIVELSNITNKSVEEVKQDLFGSYINENELHKRPLSKLIKDISEELGL